MKAAHALSLLCAMMEVSSSGYYDWVKRGRKPGPRAQQNQLLGGRIKKIHDQSRATYGSPRVRMELRKEGSRHGRNRIARLMKEQGLCGRQPSRYRLKTTDSNHTLPIAPNRLAQAPAPTARNQIWVADITYIRTSQNWLYLAAIMDLYSRKVVGWCMSSFIDTALVLGALRMAQTREQPPANLIIHSDRGVQYASHSYRAALQQAGLLASMSRPANCYDNAAMESFWSTLKMEMVYRRNFFNHQQARSEVFDYIEIFYNRQRAHSALGYRSPVDFLNQNN
jgi:putative transposase